MNKKYFPMFVDSEEKKVVVIGGGNIATRRIETLMNFKFSVSVIAPAVSHTIKELSVQGKLKVLIKDFDESDLKDAYMVLACTDDRNINEKIGNLCRRSEIPVSVCDCKEESSIWFPAVAASDQLTMGLVGEGSDHKTVKKAAAKLREIVKGKAY